MLIGLKICSSTFLIWRIFARVVNASGQRWFLVWQSTFPSALKIALSTTSLKRWKHRSLIHTYRESWHTSLLYPSSQFYVTIKLILKFWTHVTKMTFTVHQGIGYPTLSYAFSVIVLSHFQYTFYFGWNKSWLMYRTFCTSFYTVVFQRVW